MSFDRLYAGLSVDVKEIANVQNRYQEGLITSKERFLQTLMISQNVTNYLQGILNLVKADAAKGD